MLKQFDLTGDVAIISGGSKGLGESFAHALAQSGADLFLVARHEAGLRRVSEEIENAYPVRCRYAICDISSEAEIEAAVAQCMETYGKIDILVNNAAAMRNNLPPEETSPEAFLDVIYPNIIGTHTFCNAVARRMIPARKGKIVNISSMSALIVNKGVHGGSYEVSKAGVVMLTKTLATEWHQYGINVNCICPGYYGTKPNQDFFAADPTFYGKVIDMIPMGRLGNLEELWGALVLLCSPAASYMQGVAIPVDGGYTIW